MKRKPVVSPRFVLAAQTQLAWQGYRAAVECGVRLDTPVHVKPARAVIQVGQSACRMNVHVRTISNGLPPHITAREGRVRRAALAVAFAPVPLLDRWAVT